MEKKYVLIVDDDPDIVETVCMMLESKGYEVGKAYDGIEGEESIKVRLPDLLVLDIMMPHGTEGFHWVWNLRHHREAALRTVPIIVVSSIHDTTGMRFRVGDADETGDYLPIQGFLDKPVDPDALVSKIESVLTGKA